MREKAENTRDTDGREVDSLLLGVKEKLKRLYQFKMWANVKF